MARNQIKSITELLTAITDLKEQIDWSEFNYDVPLEYDVEAGQFTAPQLDAQLKTISNQMGQITRELRKNKSAWLTQASEQELIKALADSQAVRQSLGDYLGQGQDDNAPADTVDNQDSDPVVEEAASDLEESNTEQAELLDDDSSVATVMETPSGEAAS